MSTHRELAARLVEAFYDARSIDNLPDLSIAEGYAVQQLVDAEFRASGRQAIGWKIGHTRPEPMIGIIYADSLLEDAATLDLKAACAPKVEGEVLLQIATVPPVDADDKTLMRSLALVELAIEIADSRISGWPGQLGHGIADNACCGRMVRSGQAVAPNAIDLAEVEMQLLADGEVIAQGKGSNCMGGALKVYRWFIEDSARCGRTLRAGDIILTGSMAVPTPMMASSGYEVIVDGLGKLSIATGEARQ